MMCRVGELMTLDLPADSPLLELPWIVTIGPLSDPHEWQAIVLGPYERAHALALAEEIVADEDMAAVVEPITPHTSVDAIREEIDLARAIARELAAEEDDDDSDSDYLADAPAEAQQKEHPAPPTQEEIRAGVARVAARLLAENLSEKLSES
jgi:hypothetical protein